MSVNSSFVLTGSTRVLAECWPVSLGRRTWYIVRSRVRWGDRTIVKSNQAPASFDVVIIREGATQSISVRRQGTFTAYELNWTELNCSGLTGEGAEGICSGCSRQGAQKSITKIFYDWRTQKFVWQIDDCFVMHPRSEKSNINVTMW